MIWHIRIAWNFIDRDRDYMYVHHTIVCILYIFQQLGSHKYYENVL